MVNKRVINGVYFEIYKICILILNFVMYSLITNFKWLNVWNLDHNMQKTEQYKNKEMEKKGCSKWCISQFTAIYIPLNGAYI